MNPSDTAPALIALDAEMTIASAGGQRTVSAEDFFIGPAVDITRMDPSQERLGTMTNRRSWSPFFVVGTILVHSMPPAQRNIDGERVTQPLSLRAVDVSELPLDLPALDDYKPHGRPEPPLAKAPLSTCRANFSAASTSCVKMAALSP